MSSRVLITGGAGFIGSRLAHRFARDGHTVTILDTLSPQVHGTDPEADSPMYRMASEVATVVRGSVTDVNALRQVLADQQIVVHLAAETGTGQSMYEIDRYVETNIGGTAKLLDLLTNEEHSVTRVVVASSRSIYGEGTYRAADGSLVHPPHREDAAMATGDFDVHLPGHDPLELVPTDETARLHPSSVYGISKQVQEQLIMTVCPTIGVEGVALRYQNVYGPGQSLKNPYTGILSIFSTLIRQGREINVFEDGLESRDFVYIDDVIEATFLAATHADAPGAVLNVGSGVATTVLEVVDALQAAFLSDVPVRVSGNYRLGDIRHNVADTSRLAEILGFVPTVDFRTGVGRFVDWVRGEPLADSGYERSLQEMASRNLLK